jgi:hypothetical protein
MAEAVQLSQQAGEIPDNLSHRVGRRAHNYHVSQTQRSPYGRGFDARSLNWVSLR